MSCLFVDRLYAERIFRKKRIELSLIFFAKARFAADVARRAWVCSFELYLIVGKSIYDFLFRAALGVSWKVSLNRR